MKCCLRHKLRVVNAPRFHVWIALLVPGIMPSFASLAPSAKPTEVPYMGGLTGFSVSCHRQFAIQNHK